MANATPTDLKSLRTRTAELDRAIQAATHHGQPRTPGQIFRTIDQGHYPTTVPAFFSCVPLAIPAGTTECEGCPATLTVGPTTDARAVLILGPTVPPVGSNVTAHQVDGYWVADEGAPGKGGPIGVNPSGCLCQNVPGGLSVTMTPPPLSSQGTSGCSGLDQYVFSGTGFYQTTSLTYAADRASLPGYLGYPASSPAGGDLAGNFVGKWYSPQLTAKTANVKFVQDPYGNTVPVVVEQDYQMFYQFACVGDEFVLTSFLYEPQGNNTSGWTSQGCMFVWVIGNTGNECEPFLLSTPGSPGDGCTGTGWRNCGGKVVVS